MPVKACLELIDHFHTFKALHPSSLKLILMGEKYMEITESDDIITVGFCDEETKYSAIRDAVCLVNPSAMESLSIVLLEAWAMGTPGLVNAKSKVLAAQCLRSKGGLPYSSSREFSHHLQSLIEDPCLRDYLGAYGRNHVRSYFCSRESIIRKFILLGNRIMQKGINRNT